MHPKFTKMYQTALRKISKAKRELFLFNMPAILVFLACIVNNNTAFAQENNPATNSKKIRKYFSTGISLGNVQPGNPELDDFSKASYPSLELGILMDDQLSLGLATGCENFFVSGNSRIFYELKASYSIPFKKYNAYAVFGTGAYFESKFNNFIEYGAGISYMPKRLGYFVQFSNWAGSNYLSLGGTVTF